MSLKSKKSCKKWGNSVFIRLFLGGISTKKNWKKKILSSFAISHKVSQNVQKKQFFSSFFAKITFPHPIRAFCFVQNQWFLSFPLLEALLKLLNMILSYSMLKPGRQNELKFIGMQDPAWLNLKFQLFRANNWYYGSLSNYWVQHSRTKSSAHTGYASQPQSPGEDGRCSLSAKQLWF